MVFWSSYNYDYLKHKNYAYKVITAPSKPYMDLDLIKTHLKIDNNDEDTYLEFLGNAVFIFAEQQTRRTLLTTEYETFRDSFATRGFEIRKTPMQQVSKLEYRDQSTDSWEILHTDKYVVTDENYYSRIIRANNQQWPIEYDRGQQNIKITFTAGYGDNFEDIPDDLKLAMLNHVARVHDDRGDCDIERALPLTSDAIYNKYRVPNITGMESSGFGMNV
jgi:uncharacterized phiE125 gp8 family phage protein